jgi:hypothetical protein
MGKRIGNYILEIVDSKIDSVHVSVYYINQGSHYKINEDGSVEKYSQKLGTRGYHSRTQRHCNEYTLPKFVLENAKDIWDDYKSKKPNINKEDQK